MISEEDLDQDAAKAKAKAKADALLQDPKFVQTLLETRSYWRMALEDAVSEAEHTTEVSSKHRSLGAALQDDIKRLSGSFLQSINQSKSTMAAAQAMAAGLETNPDDPYEPFLRAAAGASDIKSFFSSNPQLLLALVANPDLIANFTSKKGRSERYRKIADTFLRWVDILHRGGSLIGAPVAPVQWMMMGISSPFAILGAYLNYRAAQNNPDYPAQNLLKAKSVFTMIVGLASLIAIPLILGVAGATVAAPALGILMTVYSLTLCAHNFVQLGKGLVDLYKEFRQKEPEETYKLRLSKQAFKCLKHAADVTFYLTTSAAAIAGLVGLFGNPIALGALSGAITVISYVTLGVFVLSAVLQKVADKKITSVTEGLSEIENKLKKSHSPHVQRLRNIVSGFKVAAKVREAFVKDRRENPNHDAMNFLIKTAAEHKGVILKAAREVGMEDYAKMAEKTIEAIEVLKGSDNPVLQGIEHFTGKKASDIFHETLKEVAGDRLSSIVEETALLVKIPKKKITDALIKKTGELASEVVGESALAQRFDQIFRYQTTDQSIEVHLNRDPSDEALMTLMKLNKDLQPLKMQPCGDSHTILRVMEAAKLMGVQVDFAESDIELLKTAHSHHSRKDSAHLDYFKALQEVDTKTLQEYARKNHEHHLGEVLDHIPKNWRLHKPKV